MKLQDLFESSDLTDEQKDEIFEIQEWTENKMESLDKKYNTAWLKKAGYEEDEFPFFVQLNFYRNELTIEVAYQSKGNALLKMIDPDDKEMMDRFMQSKAGRDAVKMKAEIDGEYNDMMDHIADALEEIGAKSYVDKREGPQKLSWRPYRNADIKVIFD